MQDVAWSCATAMHAVRPSQRSAHAALSAGAGLYMQSPDVVVKMGH